MTKPHTTLSEAVRAMNRAKLLPIWDNDVPHKLHVELDVIFKALDALIEQHEAQEPVGEVYSSAKLKELAGEFLKRGKDDMMRAGDFQYAACVALQEAGEFKGYGGKVIGGVLADSPIAQPTLAATQAGDAIDLPHAVGVSRDADSPSMTGVLVTFARPLSDGQLQKLHSMLTTTRSE